MFIGPYEHHSNELPWRESVADVVVIPRGRRRLHRSGPAGRGAGGARRPSTADRVVPRPPANVTGIVSNTEAVSALLHEHGATVLLGLRRRRPVRADRHGRQGRRLPVPAQADRRPVHARGAGGPAGAGGQPGAATAPAAGTVAYVNPTEHRYLTDPVAAGGGRHPGHRRLHPGRAGVPAQGGGGAGRHPRARGGLPAPGGAGLAGRARHRDPRQPAGPAAVHRVLRRPRPQPPLPAPQLRGGAAQRPVRHPVPGRLLLRRAVRAPRCWASTRNGRTRSSGRSPAAARGSSRAGSRVNFNYFISPAVFDYIVEAVRLVAREALRGCCRTTGSTRTSGLWNRHRRAGPEPPLRLSEVTYDADGLMRYPRPRRPGAGRRAGRLPGRGPWHPGPRGPGPGRPGRAAQRRLRGPALVRAAGRLPDLSPVRRRRWSTVDGRVREGGRCRGRSWLRSGPGRAW